MTKELDRRFRGLGRIKRSWGTDHKPTQRRLNDMVSTLFEIGRLDILKQIQSGELSPLQVYDAYRTNDLNRLPTAATMAPLKSRMESWIAKKECSEAHRRSLAQSLRHLLSVSSTAMSTCGHIPTALSALREKMQGKHPRSFNLARAAAQAFVKTTLGRNSKLWAEVSNVEVLKVTPQRLKHPLTPAELKGITDRMEPKYALMAWSMALTGMGPSEYWGEWRNLMGRIHIQGTKRAGRVRDVPVVEAQHPFTRYAAFRRALRDGSDNQVSPYDLRRSYANWLESAGIPRTRRRLYLGHGAKDVTDLYEWSEVTAFLAEDAAKLRAYVFGTESTGLKLVEK